MATKIGRVKAEGSTFEEMRNNLLSSEEGDALWERGDAILMWVNEGDHLLDQMGEALSEEDDSAFRRGQIEMLSRIKMMITEKHPADVDKAALIESLSAIKPQDVRPKKMSVEELDREMEAAGLTPLSQLLEKTDIDKWLVHTAVQDIESFQWLVETKRKEYGRARMEYEVGQREKDDMYEWYLAHDCAWAVVDANLKAALERSGQVPSAKN